MTSSYPHPPMKMLLSKPTSWEHRISRQSN